MVTRLSPPPPLPYGFWSGLPPKLQETEQFALLPLICRAAAVAVIS